MKSHVISYLLALAPAAIAKPVPQGPPSAPDFPDWLEDLVTWTPQLGPGGINGKCCIGQCDTVPINPENNQDGIYHEQITDSLPCGPVGTGSCSAGRSEGYTFGWHADITGMIPWASMGFGVQESWTTTTTLTCSDAPGGTACLWARTPIKMWDAIMADYEAAADTCDQQPHGQYRMTAPSARTEFYCVTGKACRSKDEHYIQYIDPVRSSSFPPKLTA